MRVRSPGGGLRWSAGRRVWVVGESHLRWVMHRRRPA